jgi:predicted ATPase
MLLVLDNLEGIRGTGAVLESLLGQLPAISVLATSQLPLGCRQERRLQLDCLGEPDALALLARSAELLDVRLADDPACVELVGLLEGLPLAIELAAGRLRVFRPAELVSRLRHSLAVLQDRGRPDRHQSLTAALDWTLGLLDRDARELFTRLGVFAGPVELEDIEAVAGGTGPDIVSEVATLLDVALLQRVEAGDGRVRFGFPEAIRQEASSRLDAQGAEALRRAHAVWQRDLVWPLRIYEVVESRLVERAHALAAETQAALDWAWKQDRRLWREIALGRYALASRAGALQEGRALIDRLLADPGDDPHVVDLVREHALRATQKPLRIDIAPTA